MARPPTITFFSDGKAVSSTPTDTAVNGVVRRNRAVPSSVLLDPYLNTFVDVDNSLVFFLDLSTVSNTFTRPSADELPSALGIPAAVPVAVWKCDETSGTTLVDSRGNVGLTASLASSVVVGATGVGLNGGAGTFVDVPVFESVRELTTARAQAATSSLLNFPSGSIGMLMVLRHAGLVASQRGIAGKLDTIQGTPAAPVGYGIEIIQGGILYIRCSDGGVGVTMSAANHTIADGAWHYIAAIWDRTANLIYAISDKSPTADSQSIATITGSLSSPFQTFGLGLPRTNMVSAGTQFAYAAIFTGSAAEALNDKAALDTWWASQRDVAPSGWTYSRASTLGCQVGSGSQGVVLHIWDSGTLAYGYGQNLSGTKLGVMHAPACTNLFPSTDISWHAGVSHHSSYNNNLWGHSGSATRQYSTDPRGVKNSVLLLKTGSQDKLTMAVSLTSGTQYCFSIYTRSTSSIPFLRVLNDSRTTVMYTEVSRSDGRPVSQDSGWHQIYMRYTPSSSSLYRFEAMSSDHSSSAGSAEFQYAQLNTGPFPLPMAFTTFGSSASTVKTVLKRALTGSEATNLGKRGALSASAQPHIHDSTAVRYIASIGIDGSNARMKTLGVNGSEQAFSSQFNDAGGFITAATTSVIPDITDNTDWIAQWDESGIDGSSSTVHVRSQEVETTSTTSISGVSDPSAVHIGERPAEADQFVGVVQKVWLYRETQEEP